MSTIRLTNPTTFSSHFDLFVCLRIMRNIIRKYDTLLEIVEKRKVRWFGCVVRAKVEGKRPRGRPVRQWLENVDEWTGLSSNEMWREPEYCVAWRKRVSRVAPMT